MQSDIFIIVHGSSSFPYTKECIDSFARYQNVIWSSWNDRPQAISEHLITKNIPAIFADYPIEQGMSKLNWQRTGFLNGLRLARNLGAKYVYKCRTDLDISNLDFILDELKYKCENGGKKLNVLCWDEWSNGCCDFLMFGDIDEMEKFWSFPNINVPSERGVTPQYFAAKNIPYNYTYQSLKQLIDTHIDLYHDYDIHINWLKDTKEDEHPLSDHFGNSAIYH